MLEVVLSLALLSLLVVQICDLEVVAFLNNAPILMRMVLYLVCRAYVILKPEFAFPLSYYLIPFTGIVGMIILVMVVILVSAFRKQTHFAMNGELISQLNS